jgi:hypothetical protein
LPNQTRRNNRPKTVSRKPKLFFVTERMEMTRMKVKVMTKEKEAVQAKRRKKKRKKRRKKRRKKKQKEEMLARHRKRCPYLNIKHRLRVPTPRNSNR